MSGQIATADGMYRYRWASRFGHHTVFFYVKGGTIQEEPARVSNPVKAFEGKPLAELVQARLASDWGFTDSLHQITASSNSQSEGKQ